MSDTFYDLLYVISSIVEIALYLFIIGAISTYKQRNKRKGD